MLRRTMKARCKKVHGMLSEYIDSALNSEEQGFVEQHLEACEACSGELESLRMTVQMLHRIPVVQVPRSFAIREVEDRREGILAPRNLRWLRPATAFAALALVVLLSVDFFVGGGGGLDSQPQIQPMFVPTPSVEIDGGGARGEMFLEATPEPTLGAAMKAPSEGVDVEDSGVPGHLEDVQLIPEDETGGWPLIRQIEVAIAVLGFALIVTMLFTRGQRRKWRA